MLSINNSEIKQKQTLKYLQNQYIIMYIYKFHVINQQYINRKIMGIQSSKNTSIIDTKFLKSLTASTPLKNIDQLETQVHQIASLSPQHHQIMLQKIRIKKNYDCPYLIKIIDSHTLQAKNLCSSITKVYIVVEKPQSLVDEIQQRIQLNLGFQQAQVWTLIYSCCMGASYLMKNNVGLSKLSTSKIFIDLKGGIKINDPDFSEGSFTYQRITQSEYIQTISQVCRQLIRYKKLPYSKSILELIEMMRRPNNKLTQIQSWIKANYLLKKKQSFIIEGFSSSKKSRAETQSKIKLRVLSGKKNGRQNQNNKTSYVKNQSSQFINTQSLVSFKQSYQDKQNYKSNQICQKNRKLELFTFKDALKGLQNIEPQLALESHLFPKKALFGQKRRADKHKDAYLSQHRYHQDGCEISRSTKQQVLTRQSHSLNAETDQSLEGSQLLNMISSYQVDQETFVREVCQQQSQYFLELINQRKNITKSSRE